MSKASQEVIVGLVVAVLSAIISSVIAVLINWQVFTWRIDRLEASDREQNAALQILNDERQRRIGSEETRNDIGRQLIAEIAELRKELNTVRGPGG